MQKIVILERKREWLNIGFKIPFVNALFENLSPKNQNLLHLATKKGDKVCMDFREVRGYLNTYSIASVPEIFASCEF